MDEPDVPRDPWSRTGALALVPLVVAAAVIGWALTSHPLSIDEAFTIVFSRASFAGAYEFSRHVDAVFVPYYTLVRAAGLGRPTVASARVLSLVCALPTIPLVVAIGTRLFDRRTAVTAAALVATNWLFLHEAREARMYALLLTVETASWLLLVASLERPTRRLAIALAVATAASLYLHPLAVANVGAEVVALLLVARGTHALRTCVCALVVGVALALPLVPFAWAAGIGQIGWITGRPGARVVWQELAVASGGRVLGAVTALVLLVAIAAAIRRRDRGATIAVVWALVPPLFVAAISVTIHPVFVARYLIEVVPAAALLVARTFWTFARGQRVVVAAIFVASALVVVRETDFAPPRDWQAVAPVLRAEARAGDRAVVFPRSFVVVYDVARDHDLSGAPPLDVAFPPRDTPPWTNDAPMREVPAATRGFWLLAFTPDVADAEPALDPHYRVVESLRSEQVTLRRYVPRDRPSGIGIGSLHVSRRISR